MTRKINVNLFSRFQDSLKLDVSDGASNDISESIQPVVDITPQIQDSVTTTDSETIGGIGTATIQLTPPENYSYNIKQISIYASIASNTQVVTLVVAGVPHVLFSSSGVSGWQIVNVDVWINPNEYINYDCTTSYSGGINSQMTAYGLKYRGA